MVEVEDHLAGLSLEDEKEEVCQLEKMNTALGDLLENCFVGSFLTSSVVNF